MRIQFTNFVSPLVFSCFYIYWKKYDKKDVFSTKLDVLFSLWKNFPETQKENSPHLRRLPVMFILLPMSGCHLSADISGSRTSGPLPARRSDYPERCHG